jgi:hypothetical protein
VPQLCPSVKVKNGLNSFYDMAVINSANILGAKNGSG